MDNNMLERVRVRLKGEEIDSDTLKEYITTASDRINLRLGVESIPKVFESIVVDVAVKMHRRTFYEGIASEGASTLSTSFVDDILSEYNREFDTYKETLKEASKVVKFL